MAYRANRNQQMRIDDSVSNLTKREQRILRGSWATAFAERVFPKINEERFAVLYSQDAASRPNTPVNVIIGAMLLKQAYGLTDEEVVEVRAVLAEKSRSGYTAQVRALLEKHGAAKLSEVDPVEYPALLEDAEELGDG